MAPLCKPPPPSWLPGLVLYLSPQRPPTVVVLMFRHSDHIPWHREKWRM